MTQSPDYEQALKAAADLADSSDDALFQELGLRIRDADNPGGKQRQQAFQAPFGQVAHDMLSTADLRRVGERWWRNLEPELMNLVCDPKNPEIGQIASGKTIPQIAASLATAAVVSTLGPPAWVIVATTILANKIAETGLQAVCQTWKESIDAKGAKP
jgi:hypothetical protein